MKNLSEKSLTEMTDEEIAQFVGVEHLEKVKMLRERARTSQTGKVGAFTGNTSRIDKEELSTILRFMFMQIGLDKIEPQDAMKSPAFTAGVIIALFFMSKSSSMPALLTDKPLNGFILKVIEQFFDGYVDEEDAVMGKVKSDDD